MQPTKYLFLATNDNKMQFMHLLLNTLHFTENDHQGMTISVKVPIKYSTMTDRTQQRLRQIVGCDTCAIHAFLGVIEEHEDELLKGKRGTRINAGKLDKLAMTAIKVKEGYAQKLPVLHDLKERFPRISQNELQECG